ncbi:MAG: cytochrome c biogenesis protein CcsA [Spirochaetales bacterium]|nr:cytochrome c biogenesis protein CcsA [Spirochaetales bacterium]
MIATIAFGLLILAAGIQIAFLLFRERKIDGFSHYIHLAAAALLLGVTIDRSIRIRFVAVTNTFESLVFFTAVIALVLFIYRLRAKDKTIPFITFGGTIVAVALLAVASSPIAPKDILPPIPALQSSWLVLHVTLSFIGESFFVVAFVCAIYYLASKDEERKKNLDRLTYTTIAIGYPIFTAGALIFGAVWAQNAWGNYWSWDPKETWALITWLVYTAYLHTRFVKRFRGKVSAVLSIVGFVFTMFTFFGVNYLLAGLHSYG